MAETEIRIENDKLYIRSQISLKCVSVR